MKFLSAAPTFAVEVSSEGDYGPAAEAEMAAKRSDYLVAGALSFGTSTPKPSLSGLSGSPSRHPDDLS